MTKQSKKLLSNSPTPIIFVKAVHITRKVAIVERDFLPDFTQSIHAAASICDACRCHWYSVAGKMVVPQHVGQ